MIAREFARRYARAYVARYVGDDVGFSWSLDPEKRRLDGSGGVRDIHPPRTIDYR
jgi:hypothetical protein